MMARSRNARTLAPDQARRVYDRIGSLQDSQAFYEDRATDLLVEYGEFASARRVFEFGCGTGRFAARLLAQELPFEAAYDAVDLSPNMVRLAKERLAPFAPRVRVEVSDGGPGVPEAERERIFEPFARGAAGAGGGVGLGLAIVQQVARHHRGHARVLATSGGGSRFEVILPGR